MHFYWKYRLKQKVLENTYKYFLNTFYTLVQNQTNMFTGKRVFDYVWDAWNEM